MTAPRRDSLTREQYDRLCDAVDSPMPRLTVGEVALEIANERHTQATEQLRKAWADAGPRPDLHNTAKRALAHQWPSLSAALVHLLDTVEDDPECTCRYETFTYDTRYGPAEIEVAQRDPHCPIAHTPRSRT